MDKNKEDQLRKQLGFDDSVPILDVNSESFREEFEFNVWSTFSSSDYRNDRERPYNGQSHTDDGERGKTIVEGLTMRDIRDCLIKAMLISSPSNKYLNEDFSKCWDFSQEPIKPTQYLLDHQNESDFIYNKVKLDTWRPQDVYKINWENIDPLAICSNLTVEIEKMMGIYPNVPKLVNNQ